MSSQVNAIFDLVPYRSPKVSTFNANHDILTDCKIGEVTPLDVIPCYPKDSFNLRYKTQAKFNPLVAPAFQRMFMKQWSFYVRNSDIWDDFNEFFTGNNPRKGKTAYLPDNTPPAHPHFRLNEVTQFGNSYLGARLNLTNIDIENVRYIPNDGDKFRIPKTTLVAALKQVFLGENGNITVHYEDGSKVKRLFPYITNSVTHQGNSSVMYRPYSGSEYEDGFNAGYESIQDISAFTSQQERPDSIPFVERSLTPLFKPGSLCDYLGFPTFDFEHFFNTEFKESLNKNRSDYSALADWCCEYYFDYKGGSLISRLGNNFDPEIADDDLINLAKSTSLLNGIQDRDFQAQNFRSVRYLDYTTAQFITSPSGSDIISSTTYTNFTLFDVVIGYIMWMKMKGLTTNMVSDCPYFSICYLGESFLYSDKRVDSLRVRGYHKIYNDYFRRPDLTAEIPIPYSDGGEDLANYSTAINTFLRSTPFDGEHMLDWNRNDLLADTKFSVYLYNYDKYSISQSKVFISSDVVYFEKFRSLVLWDLLSQNFLHLRQRDYLTSALPDTGVVDVVTPIHGSEHLDDYSKPPYSNDQFDENGNFDKTEINPTPASQISQAIGWLDLENLRITQTLKRYFTTLRHTLQGVKDYIKCYFDVDIDDLTIHRALWLGGNEQIVRVSELTSSSETDVASLGKLGGKADLYSESGTINHFTKECGFIITLHCLSPIQSNIGGLNRELIRDNKFDYFLPDFAELGDQRLDQVEVTCAPTIPNYAIEAPAVDYSKLYGYTQRYLHLKFMPNQIHGNFLGASSDWHLDLLRPAVATEEVELSQASLSESTDERIFTDVYDDEKNVKIWCSCEGTFQRALPVQQFEVLA